MRHRVKTKRLSRDTEHRKAMLKNLASSLVINKKIVTTTAKAKFLRPYIEKLITRAKSGENYSNVRYMKQKLIGYDTVKAILSEIGPKFSDRKGGYTRIVKLGNRGGDNAPLARVEILSEKPIKADKTTKSLPKPKKVKKEIEASNE